MHTAPRRIVRSARAASCPPPRDFTDAGSLCDTGSKVTWNLCHQGALEACCLLGTTPDSLSEECPPHPHPRPSHCRWSCGTVTRSSHPRVTQVEPHSPSLSGPRSRGARDTSKSGWRGFIQTTTGSRVSSHLAVPSRLTPAPCFSGPVPPSATATPRLYTWCVGGNGASVPFEAAAKASSPTRPESR